MGHHVECREAFRFTDLFLGSTGGSDDLRFTGRFDASGDKPEPIEDRRVHQANIRLDGVEKAVRRREQQEGGGDSYGSNARKDATISSLCFLRRLAFCFVDPFFCRLSISIAIFGLLPGRCYGERRAALGDAKKSSSLR